MRKMGAIGRTQVRKTNYNTGTTTTNSVNKHGHLPGGVKSKTQKTLPLDIGHTQERGPALNPKTKEGLIMCDHKPGGEACNRPAVYKAMTSRNYSFHCCAQCRSKFTLGNLTYVLVNSQQYKDLQGI